MTPLRILVAVTHDQPRFTGRAICAERLASKLAERGHVLTVLRAHAEPGAVPRERKGAMEIIRVPVRHPGGRSASFALFCLYAWWFLRQHDVVNMHMLQVEATFLALLARVQHKPAVLTYSGDARPLAGFGSRLAAVATTWLNDLTARLAAHIVTSSEDEALHSSFLARYLEKTSAVPPCVDIPVEDPRWSERLQTLGLGGCSIGIVTRSPAEQELEYLFEALPAVVAKVPEARVAFARIRHDTPAEHAYWRRLQPWVERYGNRFLFLGPLPQEAMPSFYRLCDLILETTLSPSGMLGVVQVEAMLCGTPVVATERPGLREPIRRTGMGELVPPQNPRALADAIVRVLGNRPFYVRSRQEIEAVFSSERSARAYEDLFARVLSLQSEPLRQAQKRK